ncbi:hypothetical protein [Synechococcus sp. CC9616]|uniref:hypothetical protein n=1 Tax=Synechococcus sp. CC9616 TaxID=110663 RepID=UPI0004B32811|nr:hypothetical protein [Synechococcus sp. CC9616]
MLAIAETIPPEQPWTAQNAAALDALPVSQWLSEQGASPLAIWMFGWICRGGGAQVFEPYEASMLHLCWTMAVSPPGTPLKSGCCTAVPARLPSVWLLSLVLMSS